MTALILGDLLYMTAVGMTMAFLLLKSRFPRRKTILIFFATMLLLMAVEVVLTFTFSVDLVLPRSNPPCVCSAQPIPRMAAAVPVFIRVSFLCHDSAGRRRGLLLRRPAGVGHVAYISAPHPSGVVAAPQPYLSGRIPSAG